MLQWLSPFLLLILLLGCGRAQPAAPTPAALALPPTWTPAPPATQAPPAPTATLVVQTTPAPAGNAQTLRRFPAAVWKGIGLWASTDTLTVEQAKELAPHVQLVSGKRSQDVRLKNPNVVGLLALDGSQPPEQAAQRAQAGVALLDGLLVLDVGGRLPAASLAAADKLLSQLRPAAGNRLLLASAYPWSDGTAYEKYAADAKALAAKLDGVCLCNFLRTPEADLTSFKTAAEWQKDVDALDQLTRGSSGVVLAATRLGKVAPGQNALVEQWFHYSLASYLLAANGPRVYYSYQGDSADNYMGSEDVGVDLGAAYGGYSFRNNLYVRQFARGLVAVNPGTTAADLPLGRPFVNPAGQKFTRLRLEPHTGTVLLAVK